MYIQALPNGKLALLDTDDTGHIRAGSQFPYQEVWLPSHVTRYLMQAPMTPPTTPMFGEIRQQVHDFAFECWFGLLAEEPSFSVCMTHMGTGIFGSDITWRYSTPNKLGQRTALLKVVRSALFKYPLVSRLIDLRGLSVETAHEEDGSVRLPWDTKSSLWAQFRAEMSAAGSLWGELANEMDRAAYARTNHHFIYD